MLWKHAILSKSHCASNRATYICVRMDAVKTKLIQSPSGHTTSATKNITNGGQPRSERGDLDHTLDGLSLHRLGSFPVELLSLSHI